MEFIEEQGLISFLYELTEAVYNLGINIWEVLMYNIDIGIYDGPLIGMVLGGSFAIIFIAWIVVTVINLFT